MPAAGAAAARAAETALLDAARVGTVEDVRACACRVLEIDAPAFAGVTPLHAAASRGDPEIVRALLDAGALASHCDASRDKESGWSPMHRAMYHGKWRVAALLLSNCASLDHPRDFAGRGPLDVLAVRLRRHRDRGVGVSRAPRDRQKNDLYSWGVGVNFTLGHGSRDDVLCPKLVDDLAGVGTTGVARFDASKYHSVACTNAGDLFVWGHGRGGRLGINDEHVFAGDVAVVRPALVNFGVHNSVHVTRVAAGKHHTLCVTKSGTVFSWGRSADGRLGYEVGRELVHENRTGKQSQSGSTVSKDDDVYQQTPRQVLGALRSVRVSDVSCGNKHSVVLTNDGEVFGFGSNTYGQLGVRDLRAPIERGAPETVFSSSSLPSGHNSFLSGSYDQNARDNVFGSPGTRGLRNGSPNAGNAHRSHDKSALGGWTPVCVDSLKPKVVTAVSAAKRHTVVLDHRGIVFTLGNGNHAPKRVPTILSGNTHPSSQDRSKHESRKNTKRSAVGTKIVGIAAGTFLSLMRTNLGEVQGWWSGDTTPVTPFHVRGFGFSGSQSGGAVTSLGVSKTRGALVTDGGDLYVFDVPTRSVETQQNIPPPTFEFKKVNGVRRITAVHIGEMHVLATRALTRPSVERVSRAEDGDGIHDDEDVLFSTAADGIAASSGDSSSTYDTSVASDEESDDQSHDSTDEPETPDACWFGEDDAPPSSSKPRNPPKNREVPSLRALAQHSLAHHQLDSRCVFDLAEFARSVGAETLFSHVVRFAVENMDAVCAERGGSVFEGVSTEVLLELEKFFAERVRDDSIEGAERTFATFADFAGHTDENGVDEPNARVRVTRNGTSHESIWDSDSESEVWEELRRTNRPNANETVLDDDRDCGGETQSPSPSRDPDDVLLCETSSPRPLSRHSTNEPSWLDTRVRGVVRPPATPLPVTRSKTPAGVSSRSRRGTNDAAASRVARGGLSLFLSGALEDAYSRGGGDAAIAQDAAERDAAKNAPPRTWDSAGSSHSPLGGSAPSSSKSHSLREIAAAQARESAAARDRARGYSATAARDIVSASKSNSVSSLDTSITYSPRREIRAVNTGGAVAVSLTQLAFSKGSYGGRGAARVSSLETQKSPWAIAAKPSSVTPAATASSPGPSLSAILREEEANAAVNSKSNTPSFGSYGSSLTRSGTGASRWFVPESRSPGANVGGGLRDIVANETLRRLHSESTRDGNENENDAAKIRVKAVTKSNVSVAKKSEQSQTKPKRVDGSAVDAKPAGGKKPRQTQIASPAATVPAAPVSKKTKRKNPKERPWPAHPGADELETNVPDQVTTKPEVPRQKPKGCPKPRGEDPAVSPKEIPKPKL